MKKARGKRAFLVTSKSQADGLAALAFLAFLVFLAFLALAGAALSVGAAAGAAGATAGAWASAGVEVTVRGRARAVAVAIRLRIFFIFFSVWEKGKVGFATLTEGFQAAPNSSPSSAARFRAACTAALNCGLTPLACIADSAA